MIGVIITLSVAAFVAFFGWSMWYLSEHDPWYRYNRLARFLRAFWTAVAIIAVLTVLIGFGLAIDGLIVNGGSFNEGTNPG